MLLAVRSDRLTADTMVLADVLQSLASPAGNKGKGGDERAGGEGRGEGGGGGGGEGGAPPAGNNDIKRGRKRRETADFSTIHCLLDESTTSSTDINDDSNDNRQQLDVHASRLNNARSDGAVYPQFDPRGRNHLGVSGSTETTASAPVVPAQDRQGGETADFSSIMTLVENDATQKETGTTSTGNGGKPAPRPRARRHSNQKSGRDGKGPPSAALSLVSLGPSAGGGDGGGGGGGGGGVGGKVCRPVSAKPKSPARRPRRSMNLDPSKRPTASWEVNAAATQKAS